VNSFSALIFKVLPIIGSNPNRDERAEALAQSSVNCEMLIAKSNSLQQAAEQNRQKDFDKLNKTVSTLKTANEQLKEAFGAKIGKLSDEVLQTADAALHSALDRHFVDTEKKIAAQNAAINENSEQMRRHLLEYREKQGRFFAFDSVRSWVFWLGAVTNIATLIWLIVARGL
jgi:uncharacterized protein with von Willebrand factor type A (vWA) domain